MKLELENISPESFAPFGTVLEFSPDNEGRFRIFVREEKEPWRLALFRVEQHSIKRMENHPESMESFEPLEGSSVLLAAEHERPEDYRAFFLDKPVCLFKGIWHDVLALSPKAVVKITENLEVRSEYYDLKQEVRVFLGD